MYKIKIPEVDKLVINKGWGIQILLKPSKQLKKLPKMFLGLNSQKATFSNQTKKSGVDKWDINKGFSADIDIIQTQ